MSAHRPGPLVTPRGLLTAIGLGALTVSCWPVVVVFQAAAPVQFAVLLAHVCGMLAGYAVVVLLGLMSRTPVLERGIGADLLARIHARGGRIVIGLILVHAGAAVMAWAHSRQEGTLLALWHVLRLPWLMAATIGTLALLAVGLASARAARRRLSYETWHTLHLLTYAGVALSLVHQLAGPDLTGHRWLQIGWARSTRTSSPWF